MTKIKRMGTGWHYVIATGRVRTSSGPYESAKDAMLASYAMLRRVHPDFPGDYVAAKSAAVSRWRSQPRT